MIYVVFDVFTYFFDSYLLFSIIELLFPKDNSRKNKMIFSSVLTGIILIVNVIFRFSLLPILISLVFVSLVSRLIFRSNFLIAIPVCMLYFPINYLIDFVTLSIYDVFINDDHSVSIFLDETGFERIVCLTVSKLILISIFLLIRKILQISRPDMKLSKSILFVSLVGMMASFFFLIRTFSIDDYYLAMAWYFLTISISLLLFLIFVHIKYQYEINTNNILSMRNELSEKNYTEIKSLYEINSKLFHDFNHHVSVIQNMIEEKQFSNLDDYIKALKSPIEDMKKASWTGDSVIDFILNSKIHEGEKSAIRFSVQAEIPSHTGIRSNDITIILSNLLDNAIEACQKVTNEKSRYISIVIRQINEMIFIKVKNSYYYSPQKKGVRLTTLKKNKTMHGWGLLSVENTAKKYKGTLNCEFDENKHDFTAVVNLSPLEIS
jgi:hypothetical protein